MTDIDFVDELRRFAAGSTSAEAEVMALRAEMEDMYR